MFITATKTVLISSFVVMVFNIEIEPNSLFKNNNKSVQELHSERSIDNSASSNNTAVAEQKIAKIKAALDKKSHQVDNITETTQ